MSQFIYSVPGLLGCPLKDEKILGRCVHFGEVIVCYPVVEQSCYVSSNMGLSRGDEITLTALMDLLHSSLQPGVSLEIIKNEPGGREEVRHTVHRERFPSFDSSDDLVYFFSCDLNSVSLVVEGVR